VPTAVVVLIVVAAAATLFWLAWWSSGRSKGLGRRNTDGDASQDGARLWSHSQGPSHNQPGGGTGGPSPF
jgi:hypothetical protein